MFKLMKHFPALASLQWLFTLVGAALASVPGSIWVLGIFTVIDLIFGIGEHYVKKDICSNEARAGSVRKLMQLVVAYIICAIEVNIGLTAGLGKVFCIYLTTMEFMSILEHYIAVGGQLPKVLVDALINVRSTMPKTASRRDIDKLLGPQP